MGPLPERAAEALRRSCATAGGILAYHGLATTAMPLPSPMHVERERLLGDLDALRRDLEIVPLRALLERHGSRQRTAGMIALTFDDAYGSLLSVRDALAARRVPITIFATTGAARDGSFWWDRIDELHARVEPERWRAFEVEIGLDLAYRRGQHPDHGPLRPLRQWLLREHRGRWPVHLEHALARLEVETGWCTTHRAMTTDELADLAADPLIDVGVHTHTHPVIPLLDADEMRLEIGGCFELLRRRIPKAVPILAFPFGLFDERSARAARDAGMEATLGLGDRTLAAPYAAGVLPRFSMSRSLLAWKLRLRLSGLPERLDRLRGRSVEAHPSLPSPTS